METKRAVSRRHILQASTLFAASSAVVPFATAFAQGGERCAAVRRGKAKPGSAVELAKRIHEGALPVLTSIAWFK